MTWDTNVIAEMIIMAQTVRKVNIGELPNHAPVIMIYNYYIITYTVKPPNPTTSGTCSNGRINGVVGLTNFDKIWTNR